MPHAPTRWWLHVTSFAAAAAAAAAAAGRALGTNVLSLPPLQPQTLRCICLADSVASAARLLAFATVLNGKSSIFIKRVVPNGSRHTSRSHRPRYASVRLSHSLTHPFFPPPPPLPPLLSAFDHHTDARPCSKEGLGFREARGAARYGALAVGVGLWYGCPTRLVVHHPALSTRWPSISRPPRACSRALLSH